MNSYASFALSLMKNLVRLSGFHYDLMTVWE